MEIQQLRAWRSVVATGSVRAAAQALGYSPSAVSQQITQLQREARVPLLTKVGRGIEPTPEGIALARRIDGVLTEINGLEEFLRTMRAGQASTLSIGYFPSLGTTWIPEILSGLSARHPEIRIELFVADSFEPARRPRPDLQLLVLPPEAAAPSGYEKHLLADDPFVVAVPADHPLGERVEVSLSALASEDWIDNDVPGGTCRQIVLDACAALGFQPSFRLQAPDYGSALGLVAKGLGISVLPRLATHDLPEAVVILPITDPVPVRSIHVLVSSSSRGRTVAATALELMRNHSRSDQLSAV
ncbi:LysR family transcriptional regulator [Rothia halotolerans]|uniref:LysR family transcriptional regulator n=1 Tax=Rothia halotolerans TaxID=405770 RepID=UPI00101D8FE9|nr:LysR family transcriptional regulator [Rothia halotolerans]